jgi:hypothetical protein
MIVTVQIAEVSFAEGLRTLRKRPVLGTTPGLRYAETVFAAPLGGRLLPAPNPRTVATIAAWDGDESFDAFLGSDPLARPFRNGWQVRMEPLRVFGEWPGLRGLPKQELPVGDEEPVVVLTLGRLMPWRLVPFLRTALSAEEEALAEPGLLASTGFGRLPRLVSTFSVWRSAAEMRDYATRREGSHRAAVARDRAHPFHRHSAFIRFRPYLSGGRWEGRDPLVGLLAAAPAQPGTGERGGPA